LGNDFARIPNSSWYGMLRWNRSNWIRGYRRNVLIRWVGLELVM